MATAISVLLAGLAPSSCQKTSPAKTTSITSQVMLGTPAAVATNTAPAVMASPILHNLGEVALTNHYETRVQLGGGKDCLLSPKVLDSRNVQITFALESRNQNGKVHDLSVAQVVTSSGKTVEIALGNFNLTLTPRIALE